MADMSYLYIWEKLHHQNSSFQDIKAQNMLIVQNRSFIDLQE